MRKPPARRRGHSSPRKRGPRAADPKALTQTIQGYDDGYYYPENPITRDQMTVFIARAFDLPM